MQTIADLVAGARERDGVLFRLSDRTVSFSYRDFCTNTWKVGNLLRHYGVRQGTRVAVVAGPKEPGDELEPGEGSGWIHESPDALQAFLGAAVDGAVVDIDPVTIVDATVLVAPDAWIEDYEWGPGTKPVAYGGPPDDPRIAHFEREAWSENPTRPPGEFDPADPVLAADELYSHGDLLAASRRVVAEYDLTDDDTVSLCTPVTHPGTLVAGLLAPMHVGATVVLGDNSRGTVIVAEEEGARGGGPESRVIRPSDASP